MSSGVGPVRAGGPSGAVGPVAPLPPLRLTRRGRVVVLTFFILVALGVGGLLATASRAAYPAPAPARIAVVEPYDTLWSIAERVAPGRSPVDVVEELCRLNGIDDYVVQPGQRLLVPSYE